MERVEELIHTLIEKNIQRGSALEANKISKANRLFDQIAELSRELLKAGDPSHSGILDLLNHRSPYVRLWAAFLSLEFDAERGEQALEQLSKAYRYQGFADPKILQISFSAKMTLTHWREGKLSLVSDWGRNK
jgi:hypothetical protein